MFLYRSKLVLHKTSMKVPILFSRSFSSITAISIDDHSQLSASPSHKHAVLKKTCCPKINQGILNNFYYRSFLHAIRVTLISTMFTNVFVNFLRHNFKIKHLWFTYTCILKTSCPSVNTSLLLLPWLAHQGKNRHFSAYFLLLTQQLILLTWFCSCTR